jgi:methionyl aminopeptidase
MSITHTDQLNGMKEVSNAVALTLKAMREHAKPGMTTKDLDGLLTLILYGFIIRFYFAFRYFFQF